jgi:hypothetical protein
MKLVKESIDDILKPKSKEQLIKDLKDRYIPSYNLYSYFRLSDNGLEISILKNMCKDLDILPENMEIIARNNLFTDSFLKPKFNSNKYNIQSYKNEKLDNKIFNINKDFKIIQIIEYYFKTEHYTSYIFPRYIKNNISLLL